MSTWFFTHWEAGDKATRASPIPTARPSGVEETKGSGGPLKTNELNKARVGEKICCSTEAA
jgi:hypothetical protein